MIKLTFLSYFIVGLSESEITFKSISDLKAVICFTVATVIMFISVLTLSLKYLCLIHWIGPVTLINFFDLYMITSLGNMDIIYLYTFENAIFLICAVVLLAMCTSWVV